MKPTPPTLLLSVGLLLSTPPDPAFAQSQYHWSDQFGNKSTLLNGTVIGGVSDLGSVYYNPGWLAQLDRPGFLLTAEAFELNQVKVAVGGGEADELEQLSLRSVPSLVAGRFALPFLPGHRFAYSFLTRRRSQSELLFTGQGQGDAFPSLAGEETYTNTWESYSNLSETWVGISWAREFRPGLSLGISTFGTYLSRTRRFGVDFRAVTEEDEAAAFLRFREYRFGAYGLLMKAGFAADLPPFRLGLSLTTPEITPFGGGSIRYENLRIGPNPLPGPLPEDEVLAFRKTGLGVTVHSPFAAGAGITWVGSGIEVHFSGEWYSRVPQYSIMGVDSIRGPTWEENRSYEVVDELQSVFNYGVGLEWQVSDAFSLYGSMIRDASAASGEIYFPFSFEDRVSNSFSRADAFHWGAGVSLEAKWIDLTVGVTRGAARETVPNPLAASAEVGDIPLPTTDQIGLSRSRWRFLLGFTIPMVEEFSEDPETR
jgi:hypothetical protein